MHCHTNLLEACQLFLNLVFVVILGPVHFFPPDEIRLFSDGIDHPIEKNPSDCVHSDGIEPFFFAQKNPSELGPDQKNENIRIFVATVCSLQ